MAWTVPLTAASNATLTAAQWNATVRDNLLETAPAKASAAGRFFATSGTNSIAERVPTTASIGSAGTTTTTGSYVNLSGTGVGPAVTVSSGPLVLVSVGAIIQNDPTGSRIFASFEVSGASTIAAADDFAITNDSAASGRLAAMSRVTLQSVTPGSNTFTMKYRVSGGTGQAAQRNIIAIPF